MRFIAAAAAAASLVIAMPALADPTIEEIISANRAASGGAAWEGKTSLETTYAFTGQGLTGTVTAISDLAAMRYVDSFEAGPVSGANGFDGERAWAKDPSGQVTYQEGGKQRANAINQAYQRTNALWRADRGGAEVTYGRSVTEGPRTLDVLVVVPLDGKRFELWIDRATGLTDRIVETQGADTATSYLTDYREVDDVMLPHTVRVSVGIEKYDQHLSLTGARFNVPVDDATFAAPAPKARDFEIAGGATSTTIPFTLINNHIYGNVTINGNGPYMLLFDTGGINMVTPTIAGELGLESEGAVMAGGAGDEKVDVAFTRVERLDIGAASIRDQVFAVVPLDSYSDIEGAPFRGLVGFEVFRRFVVRIDYAAGEITLIEPDAFDPQGAGTPVPFVFDHHVPQVAGALDGVPGEFQIDTGARDELTLTSPFVAKHGLRAKYSKGIEGIVGWGVGGPSRGFTTRAGRLELGSVIIESPIVTLSTQEKGSFATLEMAGNVGSGTLKHFIVTFDYTKQIMYLAAVAGVPSDGFDRAGLWLNRNGNDFVVAGVTPGAPAAEAGILEGDRITAVDGVAAKDVFLPDLRQRLKRDAPGTTVSLTVARNGTTQDIAVTLRELI